MANIDTYIERLSDLKSLHLWLRRAVLEKKGTILGQVKLRLYQKGLDANLSPLGEYTSQKWIEQRKRRGLVTSHVTLRYTGDWYRSMYLKFQGNTLYVDSSDDFKTGELETMYGEAILGLSPDEILMIESSILDPAVDSYLAKFKNIDIDDIKL